MNICVSLCIFCLVFVQQFSNAWGEQIEDDQLLFLNKKVEIFIKQILHAVRNYDKDMKGNSNSVPNELRNNATPYEINVTSDVTKTFLIKIRNGLNVTSKKFQLSQPEPENDDGREEAGSGSRESSWEDSEEVIKTAKDTAGSGGSVKGLDAKTSDDIYVDLEYWAEEETPTKGAAVEQGLDDRNSTFYPDYSEEDEAYDSF